MPFSHQKNENFKEKKFINDKKMTRQKSEWCDPTQHQILSYESIDITSNLKGSDVDPDPVGSAFISVR